MASQLIIVVINGKKRRSFKVTTHAETPSTPAFPACTPSPSGFQSALSPFQEVRRSESKNYDIVNVVFLVKDEIHQDNKYYQTSEF